VTSLIDIIIQVSKPTIDWDAVKYDLDILVKVGPMEKRDCNR
jgi:hypothetical protein